MGVMTPLAPVEPTPLVLTPHPVTLDGQRHIAAELRPGETLGEFLDRNIDLGADAWEVRIGGVLVPVELWDHVKPKHGHLIEVRGAVNRQVLMIVAMVVLTYFTFGIGTAAGWGAGAAAGAFGGGLAGALFAGAVFAAGSILINKALGPKPPKAGDSADRESVYSIAGARNSLRPHEPIGLLFGSTRIAPDILSMPYSWYEGNDQYLGMVLTPGINVDRFDELYLGDTPLSQYEGVEVWTAGFPGMPEQAIPLHSNADTIAGGELSKDGAWVVRTTPPDTIRVMVNIEYMLGDTDSKGRPYYNKEVVDIEYSPVGANTWQTLTGRMFSNNNYDTKRATITHNIPRGQWDIRVKRRGLAWEEQSGKAAFNYTSLTCVQVDEADYRGLPRIGIKIKATGQLNGTPDQIRAVFHQKAMPVWTGAGWTTATDRESGLSNNGALILAYARGYTDPDGHLVGGMGLPDSMIDVPALQAFTLHCAANGYSYDHWLQSPRSHAEVLDSIALAGFGQVTWAGGKLSVAWAADNQPLSGVVNMATMKKGTFDVDYTLVSAADGIEYTYFDRETWQTATLRVPAPGVVTMLNPARLAGEGVTTEAHAAQLSRYHLAQHLYQFKSIGFSTDLEHMTYRRLSRLALQHDMTKWGRGGRLAGAANVGGVVSLALDEPVAAPASGKAYIGVRIPGERVYRVFEVAPFEGETTAITLVVPWPLGVPLPGSPGNPAHDHVWIYDFKQTPGYAVRVVSIEPESGLKGARVSVVPESPEFWTYVKTGHYEPPVMPAPLPTRPVVSNLTVNERQVIQGDTTFTELVATFDVTGRVSHCVVYAGIDGQPQAEVAQTATRTASWRVDEAGQYLITVRPMDDEGNVGTPSSVVYVTGASDIPPPAFDVFDVEEIPGGMRRYVWGYSPTTVQAPNLAGAEIRYAPGNVEALSWDSMIPLGDGYHTVGVESALPAAGVWTFAIRARNTSGVLSTAMLTIVRILQQSIGERLVEAQEAVDQEREARIQGDLENALALGDEALARARDIAAEAQARQQQIDAERAARQAAVAAAQGRINDILSDDLLTPDEKPQLIIDYRVLMDERSGLVQQGELSEADAEVAAYVDGLDALAAYLNTLTTPTRWDDTSGVTYLT